MEISSAQALGMRMTSLLLRPHPAGSPDSVADVVTWFGAMQAQDQASALWSLGARLPGQTVAQVQDALERREALRTWPMRGTVHLVPPADAHWMLQLMGVRALAAAPARRAALGLDDATVQRAMDVLAAALTGGVRLTRAQCLRTLTDAGIDTSGQRGYHLLWYASQQQLTCIAPHVDGQQTFVLLDEWVPKPWRPDREEALATIARRYFRSHGPTTRQDFAGWTGLTAADAKAGIAAAGADLTTVTVDGVPMVVDPAVLDVAPVDPDGWWALPGFDEYLLGFKDRTLMLHDPAHLQAVVPGNNGVFRATVVRGGRVVATWKRTLGRRTVTVEVLPLLVMGAAERTEVARVLAPYARFLGLELEVRWPLRER